MTEVVIDGIQYVPSTDFNETLKVMREVLKSQEFLSDSAIENIMKSLKNSMDKPSKTGEVSLKNLGKSASKTGEVLPEKSGKSPTKKSKHKTGGYYRSLKPFKYNSVNGKIMQVDHVLPDGRIILGKGRMAKWRIQQAIVIKESMNQNTTNGMTYADTIEIAKKVRLDKETTRRIMYNIEHGSLGVYIGKWRLENVVNAPKKQPKPIENNPQKRRESGLYA